VYKILSDNNLQHLQLLQLVHPFNSALELPQASAFCNKTNEGWRPCLQLLCLDGWTFTKEKPFSWWEIGFFPCKLQSLECRGSDICQLCTVIISSFLQRRDLNLITNSGNTGTGSRTISHSSVAED